MARYKEKVKERDLTILGEKTRFHGILKFSEDLQIAGKFDGTINATGNLVVRKGASCTADYIRAASIVVEGTVQGDMTAGDRVDMHAGSTVRGNVTASRLKIADGVSFEGSVEMIRASQEGFDLFSSRSDFLKSQLARENL